MRVMGWKNIVVVLLEVRMIVTQAGPKAEKRELATIMQMRSPVVMTVMTMKIKVPVLGNGRSLPRSTFEKELKMKEASLAI